MDVRLAKVKQSGVAKMEPCDVCRETGNDDCMNCSWGNPCLDCDDYDRRTHDCKSEGACGWEKE